MLHVFVDTNVFLSLFAYTDDNIEELKKLIGLMKTGSLKLYLSEIVNQEFNRNRDKKIFETLGNFERFPTSISLPRFMEHHEESSKIREVLKNLKDLHSELSKKSREEIINLSLAADQLFIKLRQEAGLIAISHEMDLAARKRLERSNPPGKENSLGDRKNWEMLLVNVPAGEDLHIVSRDKDFSSPWGSEVPNSYLTMEWMTLKNSKLHVYSGLRQFVKKFFPEIELASDIEKKAAIQSLLKSKSWGNTHAAISKLSTFSADFSKDEALSLFDALLDNPNINAIHSDSDVHNFYQNLLVDHFDVLNKEAYHAVTTYVDDPIPF